MKIITETENLVVQLADWKGEAAQLWSFTCSHDFLIYRLTKGGMGNLKKTFLCFAGCEEISTPTATTIENVEHFAIDKDMKCFRSGKFAIIHEWWSLQDTEPKW